MPDLLNVEEAVKERYAAGAQAEEPALCCPVNYDPQFLRVIPKEIIERDYGCGDPSQHLKPYSPSDQALVRFAISPRR